MSRADLFPDAHAEGTERRVAAHWDLDWPLPIPTAAEMLACPVCSIGGGERFFGRMVLKDWKFHSRDRVGSKHPYRCDVRLKCVGCSLVLTYGVVVPPEMYEKALARIPGGRMTSWLHWREAKELLTEAGFFEEE